MFNRNWLPAAYLRRVYNTILGSQVLFQIPEKNSALKRKNPKDAIVN